MIQLQIKKYFKLGLMGILLTTLFFSVINCNQIQTGIWNQIIKENIVLNDPNTPDKSSPVSMCEDAKYFYVLMNDVFRVSKELVYPDKFDATTMAKSNDDDITDQDLNSEKFDPHPAIDSRLPWGWTAVETYNTPSFITTPAAKLSCRAIVNFKGKIYGSFSNEVLFYTEFDKTPLYNQILVLDDNGVWQETGMKGPTVQTPHYNKPNEQITAEMISADKMIMEAGDIVPAENRLFPWNEDFEPFTDEEISKLSVDERNAYQIAAFFDTNQVRATEAVKLMDVGGVLNIVYSDAYLDEKDDSSSTIFGKNPIYRLYKVDDPESASPQLTLTDLDETGKTLFSEQELLTAIQTRMVAESESYGVARYKVLLEKLFVPTNDSQTESIKIYTSVNDTVSYTRINRFYLQESFPQIFTRYVYDTVADKHLFFSKGALYLLTPDSFPTTADKLENVTVGKLLSSYTQSYSYFDKDDNELTQDITYNQYRYVDFYHYVSDLGESYYVLGAAYSKEDLADDVDDETDSKSSRFDMFIYKGDYDSLTDSSWVLQTVEDINRTSTTTALDNFTSSNSSSTETRLSYFSYYQAKTGDRNINQLMVGSSKGIMDGSPNPKSSSVDYTSPSITLVDEGANDITFEGNILSISISSSNIKSFYNGTAYIKSGVNNDVITNVPVLFALTAGNGLWINYNRYWNRQ